MKLEKICYLMPSDVHRLINNEAMVGQLLNFKTLTVLLRVLCLTHTFLLDDKSGITG